MTNTTKTRRPIITASQPTVEAAANAIIPMVPAIDARIVARSPRATLTTTTRSSAAPATKRKEPTMDPQISLWRAMASGDPEAREQLLKEHLGLVHHVARQMSKTLAVKADFDELVSSGSIGLMSALEAFDVDRGLAFSTFAAPRIRGAILDELRRQDHVPRSIRRKTREIGQARETLGRVLGRSPSDREVADHLGVDLQTLWKWRSDVEGAHHVPLDRSPSETETLAPTPIEVLADEGNDSVDDVINREQEVHHLRDAILRLKEQERTVLSLYYFEELKLHEIADILQLTESRVSQIRSKALQKLRTELSPLREGSRLMQEFNVDQLRTEALAIVQRIGVDEQLDAMIVGGLLVIVLVLALVTIWKNRRRAAETPASTPSEASGFKRWLTPMGMKSIPAEQAVVARPRRKSGSNKTIKVSTPVSKVPTRALKGARANTLDIARKTGLARDAVAMMMANANPQLAAKKPVAKPAAQPAARTAATERGMTAPGGYGAAARAPAPTTGRAVGTKFSARLS